MRSIPRKTLRIRYAGIDAMPTRRKSQGIRRRTCFTNPRKVVMVFGTLTQP
jgi:hypothetical protein